MEPPLTFRKPCYQARVYSVPTPAPAAERSRWLAELSEALGEAQRLIARFELTGEQHLLAREVHLRIEAARYEVQSLRLSRSPQLASQSDPEWRQLLPWVQQEAG